MTESDSWFKKLSHSAGNTLRILNITSSPKPAEYSTGALSTHLDSLREDLDDLSLHNRSSKTSDMHRNSSRSPYAQGGPSHTQASQVNASQDVYHGQRPIQESTHTPSGLQGESSRAPIGPNTHPTQQSQQSNPTYHPRQAVQRARTALSRGSVPVGLSPNSTAGFPDSLIYASDFMIGAGMVIIQPSTGRVVLVKEPDGDSFHWFLPKGRKDTGESLEQAALREAYEESGYRAEFLPLYIPTHAPTPPELRTGLPTRSTEPIYMSTLQWHRRRSPQDRHSTGGEYLTFWYVGQIPHDAVREENTGMPDEKNYVSHLLDPNVAFERLGTMEGQILKKAYELWSDDAATEARINQIMEEWRQEDMRERARQTSSRGDRANANESHEDSPDSSSVSPEV